MSKKQLTVIRGKKRHFWLSLEIIEKHIAKALQSDCRLNVQILDVDELFLEEHLQILKDSSIDHTLFFLSDILIQQNLVKQLPDRDYRFVIPIYGNMTMEIYRWLAFDELLKDKRVILLGASPRSCRQIERFVTGGSVSCLPFCFEADFPHVTRDNKSINLTYAGRITPQKNILELLHAFTEALNFNPHLHLHLAGDFHERQYHLHGYQVDFEKFKKEINSFNKHPQITFHGPLVEDELLKLISRSDYFISMSTYHDEDFGMSACQASCAGSSLLLSDWGGHSLYKFNSRFIPVEVKEKNIPRVSSLQLVKTLAALGRKPETSEKYRKFFSYETYARRLNDILESETITFKGVSELYRTYAKIALEKFPFYNEENDPEKLAFYMSIYEAYLCDDLRYQIS